MNNMDCYLYILSLCEQIFNEIEKGKYFDELILHLIKVIENTSTIDYTSKVEINKYTELIISEFITKGFSIHDISEFAGDAKDMGITESGDIIFAPQTYRELCRKDFNSDDLYHEAIKARRKKRTISERISVLTDCYYEEPKDCFVLIRLTGIKGDIDCMVGDINIYAPHLKRHVFEKTTLSMIEQEEPDRKYINAAVPVKHKALHSSIENATHKLDKIIDLLSLTFNTSEPIKYSSKDISIVENGRCICANRISIGDEISERNRQEFVRYMQSLDITSKDRMLAKMGERISFINNNQNQDSLKLSTAAHWVQKGKYTESSEDKLLFNWIAIESVLKTNAFMYSNITGKKDSNLLKAVQKIATAIIVKTHFVNDLYNMYIYLNEMTQNSDNYFDIPEHIVETASLNMKVGDKIYVNKFLNNINEIYSHINDEIIKTDLIKLEAFYRNHEGIHEKQIEVMNDITLIYRLRNLIVHNAIYPKYLIDIYANKAQVISTLIIRHLIDKHRESNMSIDEILINISLDYDEFVQNIDTEIYRLKS